MKRKLVKQGSSTLTVSLPSNWLKQQQLGEGDELTIVEKGSLLELQAVESSVKKTATIDVSKGFTKNDLAHYYMLGFDELVLTTVSSDMLKIIKSQMPELIGFEIITQDETSLTIKSISNAMEDEFDSILQKTVFLLKQMSADLVDALEKNQLDRLENIKELEGLNNKFTLFLVRIITKRGYKDSSKTLPAYEFIKHLERVADKYKYMCETITSAPTKDAVMLFAKVHEFLSLAVSYFLKFSTEKKTELSKLRKELTNESKDSILKKDSLELSMYLPSLIESIYDCTSSYSAMQK